MSYIISSGNKKPQWVPEPKAKKTAQADPMPETTEEPNPFFDAVKELPGIKEQAVSLGEALENAQKAIDTAKEVAVKEGVIEPGSTAAPVSEPAPVSPAPEALTPAPEAGAPAPEATPALGEVAPEAPAAPVEEKKEEGNPFAKKDEAPKTEGEAPKSEEPKKDDGAKTDSVELEIPGVKEEKKDEVEKESCGMSCGASTDNGKLKAIAKLSPENRKDLGKFWKEDLGMPSEWVDAMLKDY